MDSLSLSESSDVENVIDDVEIPLDLSEVDTVCEATTISKRKRAAPKCSKSKRKPKLRPEDERTRRNFCLTKTVIWSVKWTNVNQV